MFYGRCVCFWIVSSLWQSSYYRMYFVLEYVHTLQYGPVSVRATPYDSIVLEYSVLQYGAFNETVQK